MMNIFTISFRVVTNNPIALITKKSYRLILHCPGIAFRKQSFRLEHSFKFVVKLKLTSPHAQHNNLQLLGNRKLTHTDAHGQTTFILR